MALTTPDDRPSGGAAARTDAGLAEADVELAAAELELTDYLLAPPQAPGGGDGYVESSVYHDGDGPVGPVGLGGPGGPGGLVGLEDGSGSTPRGAHDVRSGPFGCTALRASDAAGPRRTEEDPAAADPPTLDLGVVRAGGARRSVLGVPGRIAGAAGAGNAAGAARWPVAGGTQHPPQVLPHPHDGSGGMPDVAAALVATAPAGAAAEAEPATETETAAAQAEAGTARRRPASSGFLARAFGITVLLSAGGSVLGLLRDLLLARFFGAGPATDAFLVAWTVPETAAPLLIEDAMAFLTVPAFSAALSVRAEADGAVAADADAARADGAHAEVPEAARTVELRKPAPLTVRASDAPSTPAAGLPVDDPVRRLVAATFPPLTLALTLLAGLVALFAPALVHVLAPGLKDSSLAVVCTRLTAVTVLPFGLTGYLSAGLRAHHRFGAPGAVYVAYNCGILAVMVLLRGSLGIRAAAGGVALGSLLMTAVLLPPFTRQVSRLGGWRRRAVGGAGGAGVPAAAVLTVSPLALLPVGLFTLARQAQVFIERYLGSSLPAGTISHLNYAEKIAQNVMILGILLCTITFPLIARDLAEGDTEAASRRVEKDLGMAAAVVLSGTVVLIACAPQIVALLFQRGAFTPADTAATAAAMRIYSLGLLAQATVGALIRPYLAARPVVNFGAARSRRLDMTDWFPILAMLLGLVVTGVIGAATAARYDARGLAAANAAGISVTAVLLLAGLRPRGIPVRISAVLVGQARLVLPAALGVGAGTAATWPCAGSTPLALLAGTLAGVGVFAATAALMRAPEVTGPLAALLARTHGRTEADRLLRPELPEQAAPAARAEQEPHRAR